MRGVRSSSRDYGLEGYRVRKVSKSSFAGKKIRVSCFGRRSF